MDRLQSTYYLENHPGFKDANSEFTKLHSNLDDYQKKTCDDWVHTMDGNPAKRLDNSLISKVPIPEPSKDTRQEGGMLENNFDRTLLRIFQEVHYWVKLAYMVPAQVCLSPPSTSLSLSLPSTNTTTTPTPPPTPTTTPTSVTQKIQGVFEMFKNEVQELSRMFEHQRREPPPVRLPPQVQWQGHVGETAAAAYQDSDGPPPEHLLP
jgi:hypothetical protein